MVSPLFIRVIKEAFGSRTQFSEPKNGKTWVDTSLTIHVLHNALFHTHLLETTHR
jgi:hypothetical protein